MKRFASIVYLAVALASLVFASVWVWDAASPSQPDAPQVR
ncbi:hypothetical protein BurJ1DRAFT_0462 [Burkholderiales bacterium JOSHI_001]|nr:hypothetical protein BurJ1DRAFT_0462 [Burkholderiales bacterium JOSHI_001]